MFGSRRQAPLFFLVPLLGLLAACAASPTPSVSPTPSPSVVLLTLSPVPLTLSVPTPLGEQAWVAPLTGDYITGRAADAAVQLQYRDGSDASTMVGNLLWFTIARYNELMAMPDAPKGLAIGIADGHVLFVQPALDMPFDPGTISGRAYGSLVERVRDFRWYAMSDASLTLVRPCPVTDALPRTEVDAAMLKTLTAYFSEQQLTPIRLIEQTAWVLDVHAYAEGAHACANPDGGLGGYGGSVPAGATDAVMVYVGHKPYAATGAASTFVTLAKVADAGWTVVGEGTGP